MNKNVWMLTVLAVLSLVGSVFAEETNSAKIVQPRLTLQLTDGSCIIGIPSIAAFPIRTSYAEMNIPLRHIRRVKIQEGADKLAVLDLQNGDRLQGMIGLDQIALTTVFGDVSVKLGFLTQMQVSVPGVFPKDGLVAWYRFDDGTCKDSSANGNHGVVQTATTVISDRLSQDKDAAFRFSANGEITISTVNPRLAGNQPFSISLWTKPFGTRYTKNNSGVLVGIGGDNENSASGLFVKGDSNILTFVNPNPSLKSAAGLVPNQWHHIVGTYDGKEMSVYVNNVLEGKATSPINLGESNTIRIGYWRDQDRQWYHYEGLIDEVMIYNRALSSDEVNTLYRQN
jgi:hypothetical protein